MISKCKLTLSVILALLLCMILPEGVASKKRSASAGIARGKQTAVIYPPFPAPSTVAAPFLSLLFKYLRPVSCFSR